MKPGDAVLVTGASKGIGEACALRLHGMGYRVFAGVRDPAAGAALRARTSERLVPVRLDVTDEAEVTSAAAEVASRVAAGGLAGLVNNAGIAVAAPLELIPLADLRRQLEVNVVGQVAVTQAVLPLLRRARGRIVFIGSIAGRSSLPMTGAYSASKFAVEAIAASLRVELRRWGIAVSVVEPGVIATPIWAASAAAAEERLGELPAESLALYRDVIDAARRRVAGNEARGLPPDAVARVVAEALTAARPGARYVVGRDARLRLLLERLPWRWRDRLIARALGRT
ncbi:MAG TPA: SDR family oxidoreductase [Longimicrobiales bacterium]|nr:SDR family oxidoreductase [Longimicrobiales bacterium]